jgi:hypothetical protein
MRQVKGQWRRTVNGPIWEQVLQLRYFSTKLLRYFWLVGKMGPFGV